MSGGEEATALVVMEQGQEGVGGGHGPLGPYRPAGELAQAGEAVDQPGVVAGIGQVARAPASCQLRSQRPSARSSRSQRNWPMASARVGPPGMAGGGGRLGQGRPVHGVPLGEDLVVQPRSDAPGPMVEEQRPGPLDGVGSAQRCTHRPAEDGAPLEVAALGHPVELGHGPGPRAAGPHQPARGPRPPGPASRRRTDLRRPPNRRPRPSTPPDRCGEVPGHIGHDPLHGVEVVGPPGDLPAVEEGPQQPGLVVEHLLEVGHQPLAVGRVPGEPAAEVVMDASGGHGVEGGGGHLPGSAGPCRSRATARNG